MALLREQARIRTSVRSTQCVRALFSLYFSRFASPLSACPAASRTGRAFFARARVANCTKSWQSLHSVLGVHQVGSSAFSLPGSAMMRPSACILLLLTLGTASALYEDQVGINNWHKKYVGGLTTAVVTAKRVYVATDQNAFAGIATKTGGVGEQCGRMPVCRLKHVIVLFSHCLRSQTGGTCSRRQTPSKTSQLSRSTLLRPCPSRAGTCGLGAHRHASIRAPAALVSACSSAALLTVLLGCAGGGHAVGGEAVPR